MPMNTDMNTHEIREGLRDGTVVFCLPPAHENFTSEFLEEFSIRILHQDWQDVAARSHLRIPALIEGDESEQELADTIRFEYGADVTDLPGLPLWQVIRRCAEARR